MNRSLINLISDNLWHTDLDFLFDPDSGHNSFVFNGPVISWILRPQYFNLILSLVSMSMRYASVFWFCHKGFSFTFSLMMILSSLHVLFDYSSTSVLIRLAYNPDFISENLGITFLSAYSLMILYFIGSTIIVTMFWCVFEFGFQQYMTTLSRYRNIVMMQTENSRQSNNLFETNFLKKKHLLLRGYLPHLSGICGSTIGIAMKIPSFYAGINIVYKLTGDVLILTNFLMSIIFICSWLIAWFGFSLKPTWRFTLSNCSKTISDVSSTATIVVQQLKKTSSKQMDHVYSCFHNLDNRVTVSDNSLQNRLRNRDYFVEEADMSGKTRSTNYVYLQRSLNSNLNRMHNEFPLITQYIDNSESKNIVLGCESPYDSATNVQSHFIPTLDYQIGRSQSQALRNFGVLKYFGDSLLSNDKDYVPFQSEGSYGVTTKFDNCSSPETSTLHAAESDTTLRFNPGSQNQLDQTNSMNRQNSNKNRTFRQKVTFRDERSNDVVDSSPNNSEQSSNNTASSDSGIDFKSKQNQKQNSQQTSSNCSNPTDYSNSMAIRSSGRVTNTKYIPTSIYSTITSSQCNSEGISSNEPMLIAHFHSSFENSILENETDNKSVSCISEDLPDQRLCSQV